MLLIFILLKFEFNLKVWMQLIAVPWQRRCKSFIEIYEILSKN